MKSLPKIIIEHCCFNLTLEQALFIQKLRQTCSWRAVATYTSEEYPDLDIDKGNQLDGIELCKSACERLGLTYSDGWMNINPFLKPLEDMIRVHLATGLTSNDKITREIAETIAKEIKDEETK